MEVINTKERIEFITVALETCSFVEQLQKYEKKNFVGKLLKILPLIYLKASLLELPERNYEDLPERFVTEYDYERIRQSTMNLLQESDDFLTVYSSDIQLSDSPIYATVSEFLADIYQELKDYVLCCQYNDDEIQNDALWVCLTGFAEHWGTKLLSIMQALHSVHYGAEENEI